MTRINKLGGSTPTLIHPTAVISPSATIGKEFIFKLMPISGQK